MSLLQRKWKITANDDKYKKLSKELNVSDITAKVLINRGFLSLSEAKSFISPKLSNLADPMDIPNIELALKRLIKARDKQEKVLIYGDYDVDGVTATSILLEVFQQVNIQSDFYIPHRYNEGYSLSEEAINLAHKKGINLIVTVDCGVSNVKEIDYANSLGIEVIVTDHHNIPATLPNALAIVNPKLIPRQHPSRYLSGAGVAFKLAWALLRAMGIKDDQKLINLLDLVGLGTIADMVPLTGENRVFAVQGMKLINKRKRKGIKYLIEASSISKEINVNYVNFIISPRLNAAGRLEHASLSVNLLLAKEDQQAQEIAKSLNKINTARQGIGADIGKEVFKMVEEQKLDQNEIIVLAGEDWHPGVIGIVASQVADRYYRPTVLIGINEGVGRGSARSIGEVNVYELLNSCRDLFVDFGGHEGAAGFEIEQDKIKSLNLRLLQAVKKYISPEDLIPKITIDTEINPNEITLNLIKELESLDPFGEGNPAPIFISRCLKLVETRVVGSRKNHIKAKFWDGQIYLDVIGFNLGQLSDKLNYQSTYDLAYNLESNYWNGMETAQLNLIDIRETKAGG